MPRRITERGPLQSIRLRGKTLILAQKGDSLYPAVIPRSATGGATNYSLTCNAGSYTLTGSSVTISRNRALTASAGSYTYTGSQTTINHNRALTASPGSYTCTGSSVSVNRNLSLTASAGSYALTGQSVDIEKLSGSGAVGGGGGGGNIKYAKRSTMAYVVHRGKILVFTNDEEAIAWLAAQEAIDKAKAKKSHAILKLTPAQIEPVQEIKIAEIKATARIFDQATQIQTMLDMGSLSDLMAFYQRLKRDEEELTLAMVLAA